MRFAALLAGFMLLVGCSKEQKIVFTVTSFSYTGAADEQTEKATEQECRAIHRPINAYLEKGWRVVASSAKQILVRDGKGTCTGTEYVIEK